MRTKFYLVLGYGTLVVDIYLVLASTAAKMMNSQYRSYLPPFGSDGAAEPSRFMVLLLATWTAILALGCLRANNLRSETGAAPGTLWFVLVLATVWLVYSMPVLWNVFAQGL